MVGNIASCHFDISEELKQMTETAYPEPNRIDERRSDVIPQLAAEEIGPTVFLEIKNILQAGHNHERPNKQGHLAHDNAVYQPVAAGEVV